MARITSRQGPGQIRSEISRPVPGREQAEAGTGRQSCSGRGAESKSLGTGAGEGSRAVGLTGDGGWQAGEPWQWAEPSALTALTPGTAAGTAAGTAPTSLNAWHHCRHICWCSHLHRPESTPSCLRICRRRDVPVPHSRDRRRGPVDGQQVLVSLESRGAKPAQIQIGEQGG